MSREAALAGGIAGGVESVVVPISSNRSTSVTRKVWRASSKGTAARDDKDEAQIMWQVWAWSGHGTHIPSADNVCLPCGSCK